MKIYKNVLSDNTFIEMQNELNLFTKSQKWGVNRLTWDNYLLEGMSGICLATHTSDVVKKLIHTDIKHYLPENCFNIVTQYYYWGKHSGIAWHKDSAHLFGATIYLNVEWNINHGGLFVWEDKTGQHVHRPEYNSMIVNDDDEYHMVTSVSAEAPYDRLTIQIWGELNE